MLSGSYQPALVGDPEGSGPVRAVVSAVSIVASMTGRVVSNPTRDSPAWAMTLVLRPGCNWYSVRREPA